MARKFALVELKPLTGRTHQLRVHMAAIAAPSSAIINTAAARATPSLSAWKPAAPACAAHSHPGLRSGKAVDVSAPLPNICARAQGARAGHTRNNFYGTQTQKEEKLFTVSRNGSPMKTPQGHALALPTKKARRRHHRRVEGTPEFNAYKMPLSLLAFTALDRIEGKQEQIVEVLLAYVDTDALSYRASGSEPCSSSKRKTGTRCSTGRARNSAPRGIDLGHHADRAAQKIAQLHRQISFDTLDACSLPQPVFSLRDFRRWCWRWRF